MTPLTKEFLTEDTPVYLLATCTSLVITHFHIITCQEVGEAYKLNFLSCARLHHSASYSFSEAYTCTHI